VTADEYCRGLEAHLTRRNDGHLIRVVGPAFEMVRGWFERGVPFKIACHGIDRTVERYYARGPRRRPVRIEYCEADVLDAFDEWRRAVGVRAAAEEASVSRPKREGLATAIRRAIARLTALRASSGGQSIDEATIDEAVRRLDELASRAERARGAARTAIVVSLDEIDASLLSAAERGVTPEQLTELRAQAERDLAPFRERMPPDSYRETYRAAFLQLLRTQAQLPMLSGHGAAEPASGTDAVGDAPHD
jgi:hypothetical protein